MVFESVCLVDMIALDMFRTHVGWKEVVRIFFLCEVSREPSRKIAQNSKNGLVKPKKAWIWPFSAILSNFQGRFH